MCQPVGAYEYSRTQNPTREAYEGALACVEDGKHGAVFSSGIAAMSSITQLLKAGEHVVCMDDVYGGTHRFFTKVAVNNGIEMDFIDLRDESIRKASLRTNTRMIWIESPTNPTLKLVDIQSIARIAHEYNKDIIVVVDNTFMSPYFQRPLNLGADIVMHSVTKYLNGHSDVCMGAAVTRSDTIGKRLHFIQNAMGATPSPFDCYLAHRGLKTLHLRMKAHGENAMKIALFLENHPRVSKCVYPGLQSHPQHALARSQMTGFGGMLSFYLKGDGKATTQFLQRLKIFTLAESLGAVESLVEVPALMTHHGLSPAQRAAMDISDNMIRISVGVEDVVDLIQDLDNALAAI
ncbi:cystathionine gamma-lyase [Sphaeroforma arctica JP610]|uniref:cystathionine gamma-lyase n=1 Tax=Sphaeroforma arctica JP610 TaxID=667725 RepID=A0A0L0GBF3_9EUKA|nr:cystathionine gamma-lyase [Sphaeroforma arctica JP610]KNC86226.1 cystathionine gamma-lyase [Sphaeroforma arctica JP610]|eukprot:XP_014160128.1 cystathionine gamma-lyase [Sphaeroforma arctica JP610]